MLVIHVKTCAASNQILIKGAPPLRKNFPLRMVRLSWNFQGWVILLRYASGKNFSSIGHTRPNYHMIHRSFLAFRRPVITRSLKEMYTSGWFQIKANTCTHFFTNQNFEIFFRSFFMIILVQLAQNKPKKGDSTRLNLAFLNTGIKYKKSGW